MFSKFKSKPLEWLSKEDQELYHDCLEEMRKLCLEHPCSKLNDTKENMIVELNHKLQEHRHKLSSLKGDNSLLSNQLSMLEDQNCELITQNEELVKELAIIKEQLRNCNEDRDLEADLLSVLLKNLESSRCSTEEQLTASQKENTALTNLIVDLEEKCSMLETQLKYQEEIEDELSLKLDQVSKLADLQRDENSEICLLYKERCDLVRAQEGQLKELANRIGELYRELIRKENELIALQKILGFIEFEGGEEKLDQLRMERVEVGDLEVDEVFQSDQDYSSLESQFSSRAFSGDDPLRPDSGHGGEARSWIKIRKRKKRSFWEELQTDHPDILNDFAGSCDVSESLDHVIETLCRRRSNSPAIESSCSLMDSYDSAIEVNEEGSLSLSSSSLTSLKRVKDHAVSLVTNCIRLMTKSQIKIARITKNLTTGCKKCHVSDSAKLTFDQVNKDETEEEDDGDEEDNGKMHNSLNVDELGSMLEVKKKHLNEEIRTLERILGLDNAGQGSLSCHFAHHSNVGPRTKSSAQCPSDQSTSHPIQVPALVHKGVQSSVSGIRDDQDSMEDKGLGSLRFSLLLVVFLLAAGAAFAYLLTDLPGHYSLEELLKDLIGLHLTMEKISRTI